ncbi:hypothetical protein Ddc_19058 [Ditylenchus destructor]|nr:hypothetical protein Ddc_19058 [Ditylenchus destructor]
MRQRLEHLRARLAEVRRCQAAGSGVRDAQLPARGHRQARLEQRRGGAVEGCRRLVRGLGTTLELHATLTRRLEPMAYSPVALIEACCHDPDRLPSSIRRVSRRRAPDRGVAVDRASADIRCRVAPGSADPGAAGLPRRLAGPPDRAHAAGAQARGRRLASGPDQPQPTRHRRG